MENALSISTARSILLAVDDEDYSVITQLALERSGFEGSLHLACSSEELKRALQKVHSPDLVVLDLNTKSNDWRECVQYLKEDKNYKKIPVVVLTAVKDQADIDFCMRFDRCSYVDKPRSFDDWRACTEKMIHRKFMGRNPH